MAKKLEVKDLTISFRTMNGKVKAVRDISFDLEKGETLAIVGESGSGKSVTSKAIMGISAVNAICESGEILYDGQDLTKISEEQFHRLRGNKIAMIFQDPLSSLNPIMRIGKQLTEAMLLKGKANQKEAKENFENSLELLEKYLFENFKDDAPRKAAIKEKIAKFKKFSLTDTKIENEYNIAKESMLDALEELEDLSFKLSKKAAPQCKKDANVIMSRLNKVFNPYLIKKDDNDYAILVKAFKSNIAKAQAHIRKNDYEAEAVIQFENSCNSLIKFFKEVLERPELNFFGYAFFKDFGEGEIPADYSIEQINEFTHKYLDENFMLDFINDIQYAIKYGKDTSDAKKQATLPLMDEIIEMGKGEINRAAFTAKVNELIKEVKNCFDLLEFKVDNTERTFEVSVKDAMNKYFNGIESNKKEEIRFAKDSKKHARLVARGKDPSWKVIPKSLVDLDRVKSDIVSVVVRLKEVYVAQIERFSAYQLDRYHKRAIKQIDYFKDQASKIVHKVTPAMAKNKAIKLMEEVGIAEARDRYNRYPFEFSGGMRQRIVIAIALAADPDILICDEPTTALDVTIQSQILELINKIKKERELSIIFITHDLGVVANMADRVAVMYAGKIVEYGTSSDVFYDPRHPYTWALLSSMPDLETKEKLEAIPGTPPNMIYPPVGDAFAARNKYALKIDFEKQPPLFKVSDTHFAATWLLHPDAPRIDPPKIVTDRIARMKKETEKFMKGGK